MFDLQALAFAADITRVFALKLSRDVSNRVFTEAGATTGFHIASHHNEREDRITDFAKINTLPRQPDAVLPREAEADARRRRQRARQLADRLRIADGQFERAQPQALPAVLRRPRRRRAQGQHAHQGAGRHADGQRDARRRCSSVGLDIDTFGDSTGAARSERGDGHEEDSLLAVLDGCSWRSGGAPLSIDAARRRRTRRRSRPPRCARMRRRCARWSRTARTSTPRRATA